MFTRHLWLVTWLFIKYKSLRLAPQFKIPCDAYEYITAILQISTSMRRKRFCPVQLTAREAVATHGSAKTHRESVFPTRRDR